MSRTVIDIDDVLLAEAAKLFGTSTKVATVNAALSDAVNRARRNAFVAWLADGNLPDLADEQIMAGAWPKPNAEAA